MSLSIKLNGKSFSLGEWELVSPSTNWARRLLREKTPSLIGWQVSWSGDSYSDYNCYHWIPMFLGKLYFLSYAYNDFYPSPKPYFASTSGKQEFYPCLSPPLLIFRAHQIEEAKKHMDDFLKRVNSLGAFL